MTYLYSLVGAIVWLVVGFAWDWGALTQRQFE